MIHQEQINKITSLVAALQHYVNAKTDMGLNDVSASIEVLVAQVLRETEDLNLKNQNVVKVNFPAIDLADDQAGVAVQVTSNVSTEKWQETVAKFKKHKLNKKYNSLRIIGFCSTVKPRNCPRFVNVQGFDSILNCLKTLTPDALQRLEQLLRSSYDFSKLSPLSDRDCFGVVLGVIDRDAIRHYTNVEGSFPGMANALKEIREIINSGQVKDKNIYAKPLSHYSAPYYQLLLDVDLAISAMLAELNRAKQHQMYFLTAKQKQKLDGLRGDIIRRVNAFCRAQGINRQVQGISSSVNTQKRPFVNTAKPAIKK
jgi:hypothetical protein